MCTSDQTFVAIAAPRGHAKSTAITHCYTLASVLFKDRRFVLIVSDTYEQAVLFLKDIATELDDNEDLQALFGKMTFEKAAENDIIVKMEDGHTFRIMAKGSEQKVRGLKWNAIRPDLIIGDDLENDEIVLNKERREKFKKWFTGALLPCRSDRGVVRIVGTILHMDSLLENLMPKRQNRRYVTETGLKVYYSRGHHAWHAVKYRAHNSDFSEILWPEKWPRQRLEAERERYRAVGNPEGYSQEYLNEPIDDANAYFRKQDFLPMTEEDFKKNKKIYMAVDFAISTKEKSDFTVMVVGGLDDNNVLHILDVLRERLDGEEIVRALFLLCDRYKPEMITLEAGAIEKALGPFIFSHMYSSGKFLNLNPKQPSQDKRTRARSIQARLRARGVRFDMDASWYPELEAEMLTFDRGVHDDQVDAMAWLGLTLDQMAPAETPEELEEMDYDELWQSSGQLDLGRNLVTGY